MLKVAVLVSGGGTNLQAILDAQEQGRLGGAQVSCVISSSPDAYALERAKKHGVPTEVVRAKDYASREKFDRALLQKLEQYEIGLVVLAGFMLLLGKELVDAYRNRIINVHPALIPSFCGKGFMGLKVHETALQKGVKLTGATVHFVNEIADGGPILLQKAVPVLPDDTPESLQKRVMVEAEWKLLPEAIALVAQDKVYFKDGLAYVRA